MLKKTITYVDYDGNERTDDFYFNLNKVELFEVQFAFGDDLPKLMERLIKEKNQGRIITIFKDLVLKAYGEKSIDGKRFVKNQDLRDGFEQSEAYPSLFMELATNAGAASAFINGIVPADLQLSPDQLVKLNQ